MTAFKPGDRVTATHYGQRRTGTVTHTGPRSPAIVWVRWDDNPTHVRWTHAVSLTRE